MTVKELMEELKKFDPELPVLVRPDREQEDLWTELRSVKLGSWGVARLQFTSEPCEWTTGVALSED
jgi:hypothetical protein